jgi:predicted DNA-binding transcriptional regulator AlpA
MSQTSTGASKLIRFKHLKERGIVDSWAQLSNLVQKHGFPCGFYLGSNTRVWRESEIEDWLANRPTTQRAARKEAQQLTA